MPSESLNKPDKERDTGLTIKVRPPSFAQRKQVMQKQKLEGGKTRQIPSIGMCRLQPKARVGMVMQRTPKMMQTRPKEMMAKTPKFESAETPTFKIPLLQTSLRLRLSKTKSSDELEEEKQEKAPKFKARPVNKKILESKGQLGLFANKKRPVTIPQEFHFAIDKRIPPPRTANDAEFYDKMASCLESHKKKLIPTKTIPRPFHFRTDKRGAGKEERIRIPKCSPFSCTTDRTLVRSKSESRHHTKPEPFQLDSLVRHKNEIQRKIEQRNPLEDEEANTRTLKEDTPPVPERVRRPLTDVQELNLHVEQRAAIGKTEFDKKLKEKETLTMVQEENSIPHAGVPSFKQPSLPKKYRFSEGVTKSTLPRSDVCIRKEGRRKMVLAKATSSAASNMTKMSDYENNSTPTIDYMDHDSQPPMIAPLDSYYSIRNDPYVQTSNINTLSQRLGDHDHRMDLLEENQMEQPGIEVIEKMNDRVTNMDVLMENVSENVDNIIERINEDEREVHQEKLKIQRLRNKVQRLETEVLANRAKTTRANRRISRLLGILHIRMR